MEAVIPVIGTVLIVAVAIGLVYGLRWRCLKSTGSYSMCVQEAHSPYYLERSASGVNSSPHSYYADYDHPNGDYD